ncbi:aglC [Symbiodinium natans]|uniref:AglC protein n=1 Tax=Symbiodinium natans TaxID=878477 RepID=A0A812S1V4_9DINO|nr:aglC [Symbiodinium natans]
MRMESNETVPSEPVKVRPTTYVKVLTLTCLAMYPFFALLTSKLETGGFVPCAEECVFMRYSGVPHLPSTAAENVELTTGKPGGWWAGFPLFVSVRNGHGIRASYPPVSSLQTWLLTPGAVLTVGPWVYTSAALKWDSSNQVAFPDTEEVNDPDQCEHKHVRQHIDNHLAGNPSKYLCLLGLVLWATCNVAHDWALLYGCEERITLKIAHASWCCQAMSCVATFMWSTGAAEVFVAPSFGCYYQLDVWETILIALPPFILLAATEVKRGALVLSVCHGDYLFSVNYQLPFRMVRSTRPSSPAGTLLTIGLHGDRQWSSWPFVKARSTPTLLDSSSDNQSVGKCLSSSPSRCMPRHSGDNCVAECPAQKLSFKDMDDMEFHLSKSHHCWTYAKYFVIAPFAMGPLVRRLISVFLIQEWSLGAMGGLKLAVAMMLLASVAAGIFPMYFAISQYLKVVQSQANKCNFTGHFSCWNWYSLLSHVWFCILGPFFSLGAVLKLFWFLRGAGAADELESSWYWHLHGTSMYIYATLSYAVLKKSRDPNCMLQARTLKPSFPGWEQSYLLKELNEDHPDWQMTPYLKLCGGNVENVKTIKKEMREDATLPHVEQAWKVLSKIPTQDSAQELLVV